MTDIEFTADDLQLINGLIVAEARRLEYWKYPDAAERPTRLKRLARVRRKILQAQRKW
jgi:hypothetical protein